MNLTRDGITARRPAAKPSFPHRPAGGVLSGGLRLSRFVRFSAYRFRRNFRSQVSSLSFIPVGGSLRPGADISRSPVSPLHEPQGGWGQVGSPPSPRPSPPGEGETLPAFRRNGHCESKEISGLVAGKKFIPLKTARNRLCGIYEHWMGIGLADLGGPAWISRPIPPPSASRIAQHPIPQSELRTRRSHIAHSALISEFWLRASAFALYSALRPVLRRLGEGGTPHLEIHQSTSPAACKGRPWDESQKILNVFHVALSINRLCPRKLAVDGRPHQSPPPEPRSERESDLPFAGQSDRLKDHFA